MPRRFTSHPDSLPRAFARYVLGIAVCFLLGLVSHAPAWAQSQALNGQIEGRITDASGAVVAGATVTITNTETGTKRTVTTNADGLYVAPLLPLGTYQVEIDANGFKRLRRDGITLTTGQTATVSAALETGGASDVVIVSGDAPIADAGKIDLGRVLNEREIKNIPLVSRNIYNFGLLQANITGRPNEEFGVPRINANGFARRINYQLDGNNNTQADRAGIRLMPISEVFVQEVQLVTNGFAAEFGNTPGAIFNAITPSGTNQFHGSASYMFRRTGFSSRPFGFNPALAKPGFAVDNVTGAVGGPIIKDRWQFYTGYEYVKRDLAGQANRVLAVTPANQAALIAAGLSQSAFPGSIPASQKVNFFIVRTDVQLSDKHRLVGRYNLFRNTSPNNITNTVGGAPATLERSVDFIDKSDSVGVQLVSSFTPTFLNELRYQFARRDSRNLANNNSGTGPAIVIAGVASFGAPENNDTIAPLQTSNQFTNNTTLTFGAHTIKFGGTLNTIGDTRRAGVFARYLFPSIAAYVAARNGTNTAGYTQYVETIGNPNIDYRSNFYSFFVQDDWKPIQRLKINYGLRYDLYDVPEARADSPLDFSRDFKIDKNNFAPRLGLAYSLREGNLPTVLRASAGIYYDPPLIDMYDRALQNNGSPLFAQFQVGPTATGAPRFPSTLGSRPAGAPLPTQAVTAVSPDFNNLQVIHANLQIEQALSRNYSITIGFTNSRGTQLPVYRNINLINPVRFLADGRPVYNTAVNAQTRRFPQFSNIFMAESAGSSYYTSGNIQLTKRFADGYQFSASYTLARATDDAPEQNLVAVTGRGDLTVSDPTNRRRDKGNSFSDQRHNFNLSFVGRPTVKLENRVLNSLVNDNQVGIILTANSGETFNILSNQALLGDGTLSGRPLGIGRNTGVTPNQFNVDFRYTRYIRFSERYVAQVFGEFINLFNVNSRFNVNGVVTTDANGAIVGTLPDFSSRARTQESYQSRQFQLGFKFTF